MSLPDPRYRVTARRHGQSPVIVQAIRWESIISTLRTFKGPEWSTYSILDYQTGQQTHGDFPWTTKKRAPALSSQLSLPLSQ